MAQTIAEAWMEEGQIMSARTLLRQLLEDRFDALPEALVQQINTTTDLDRLHAAFRQALRLDKLEDLRL
jgi:hypothetical protein